MTATQLKLALGIVSFVIWASPATAFLVQEGSSYQGIIVPYTPPGGQGSQGGFVMHGSGDEHSSIGVSGHGTSDFGRWVPDSDGDDGPSYLGPHYPGPGSREFFLAYADHKYCCNATYDAPVGDTAVIPEPATLALLGLALAGLGYTRRRRPA